MRPLSESDQKNGKDLLLEVQSRNFNRVEKLIKNKVNVNYQDDKDQSSALIISCNKKTADLDITSLLLENKADPNLRGLSSNTLPLLQAIHGRNFDLVKILVSWKADINSVHKKNLDSPLMVAALLSCNNILLFLIENGGNVNKNRIETNDKETNLYNLVLSLEKFFKITKQNIETREIVKFYQEISKNILELINDPKLDLQKLDSGLKLISSQIEKKKFTIHNSDQDFKVPAPKINLCQFPLNHQGDNLFSKAPKFAMQNKWPLIDYLKKNGLRTDVESKAVSTDVKSKGVSIDMIRKLNDSSTEIINKISGHKFGNNVSRKITEFIVDKKDERNLSLIAKSKIEEKESFKLQLQPETSLKFPQASQINVMDRSREFHN
jgi:Ankyrin repeats (3 copies)